MKNITYKDGTVFNANAKTIVNTVNCEGFMGKGIALEFKLRYPEMYEDYKQKCEEGKIKIGRPYLYKYDDVWILNFPTKHYFRYPSKLEWVEEGLKYFRDNYNKVDFQSVAFPQLGAGYGGIPWNQVKNLMEKYLGDLEGINISICLNSLSEPEGDELRMVTLLNSMNDINTLKKNIKLTEIQSRSIIKNLPIKRMYELSECKGIGTKTYEKVFRYLFEDINKKEVVEITNQMTLEDI